MTVPILNVTDAISQTLIRDLTGSDSPWAVILLNDDVHTFEQVIRQLQKAIGCDVATAQAYAMEVHTTGSAKVYEGDLESCERVAKILEEIRLQVKLQVQ